MSAEKLVTVLESSSILLASDLGFDINKHGREEYDFRVLVQMTELTAGQLEKPGASIEFSEHEETMGDSHGCTGLESWSWVFEVST